jgi:protease I
MNSEKKLKDKRVAILVDEGFEQVEMIAPRQALEAAGARTFLLAPRQQEIRSWRRGQWCESFQVDAGLDQADPEEYHALLLPGGVLGADKLRTCEKAVPFVKHFFMAGKPVAAICHGPWILIDANVVKGRSLTSAPSIKADLANAGAMWFDQEVVVNDGLVTSRSPADLPAFNSRIIEEFAEGAHKLQIAPSTLQPPSPLADNR